MFGNVILILPFGLLPLLFVVGWVFYTTAEEGLQRRIGQKVRAGITEFPTEVSMFLYGENDNKISFSGDGTSVVLTIGTPYFGLGTTDKVKEHLRDIIRFKDGLSKEWVDQYIVKSIVEDRISRTTQISISIPDDVVFSEKYITHEIQNLGRVFKRNCTGNSIRWMLCVQGDRRVERKDKKLLVYISRLQLVPGLLDEKLIIMSEKQITRNIKNRLWNRVDVRCIHLDDETYCAEIVGA